MTIDHATDLARDALLLALQLGAPILLMAAAVGLFVSLLQAVTQIQDQTLSVIPKFLAVVAVVLYVLPWLMTRMSDYSTDLIRGIPMGL